MTQTMFGDIGNRTAGYLAAEMLKHAEPVMVLQKLGQSRPIPKNKTRTIKFRRPVPFTVSTVPLQEGVTPSATQFSYEDVETTLKQYGRSVEITDLISDNSEDPVLQDISMLLGEDAGLTYEMITYNAVKGGTNVFYANGSARNAVNTVITLAKQRSVTRSLKAQKAKKLTKILAAGPNFGTSPIEASYVAVAHTDLESDIRGLAGFQKVAEYSRFTPICPEEIGAIDDVRYVLSPELDSWPDAGGTKGAMTSTSGTDADVYPVLFFGSDAFGLVPLKGENAMTPMIVNAKPTDSDPLAQRGHAGWKGQFAALILNQAWMARLEVAATA